LPKTVNRTWYTVMDQGPLMGASSDYAKRVWGYAPVEADGSAYFEAPAGKELYFQACDEEGRELQRMTSATQLMPGETQSCAGCHENRETSPPASPGSLLAMQRAPTRLTLPEWGNAGVLDYNRVVQPVLDRHCIRCHQGTNPDGGLLLTGGYTRFFNMSYDNLVVRSRAEEVSRAQYIGRSTELPMVQSLHLLSGIMVPFRPLTSGSFVSRLPGYFQATHCQQPVPQADRQRIHEWIDAMIPYYPTTDYARREARSNRDKWGQPDGKDLLEWFTQGFAPVYERRCSACHGKTNELGLPTARQWAWIDLTRPEWSPALTAHLAKSANGRGIPAQDFQFSSTADPDYQSLLRAFAEGGRKAHDMPEADMPGFVNRSQDRAFPYRESAASK
jgi:mono/diheme cytochrome c family protein